MGAPTNPPTSSPIAPTTAPTIPPTASPTTAPTQCNDGGTFYLNTHSRQTCKWLSSSKWRINKYCTKSVNWGKHEGVVYGPPAFVCRKTCSSCDPCYENKNARFYYKQTTKGKVVVKNCAFLQKRKEKKRICSVGKTNGVYPPAHEVCPKTCKVGTC